MGHKVNPIVIRLGMSTQWTSRWFNDRDYIALLRQDITVRRYLKKKLKEAGIDHIDIERQRGEVAITIHAAKPGMIIGRGGTGIDDLRRELLQKYLEKKTALKLNIQEVENPNLSANGLVQSCIFDIEKRIPFRRVMKQHIDKALKAGAKGVKVAMAGRLNGAEIARREMLAQGSVPLHTLRADIDYARGTAQTTYGVIGIKVWIYKGLYFPKQEPKQEPAAVRKIGRQSVEHTKNAR